MKESLFEQLEFHICYKVIEQITLIIKESYERRESVTCDARYIQVSGRYNNFQC